MSDYDEDDYDDPEYVIDAWADDVGKDHPDDYRDEQSSSDFDSDGFWARPAACDCFFNEEATCATCRHKAGCADAEEYCDDSCHSGYACVDCGDGDRQTCRDCSHIADCPNEPDWCYNDIHFSTSESTKASVTSSDSGLNPTTNFAVVQRRKPAKHRTRWSLDEDLALRSEYLAGDGVGAIAVRHERTTSSIRARLVGLCFPGYAAAPKGIPFTATKHGMQWSQEDDSAIRQAWLAGDDIQEVAKALKRKPFSIAERLIKLRVPNPLSEEELRNRHGANPNKVSETKDVSILELRQMWGMFLGGADLELVAASLNKSVPDLVSVLSDQGLISDSDLNLLTPGIQRAIALRLRGFSNP